jgi:hypothetical protein
MLRTPLVLSTAEQIFVLIEAGIWTREFPPVPEMSSFCVVGSKIEQVFRLLTGRQSSRMGAAGETG